MVSPLTHPIAIDFEGSPPRARTSSHSLNDGTSLTSSVARSRDETSSVGSMVGRSVTESVGRSVTESVGRSVLWSVGHPRAIFFSRSFFFVITDFASIARASSIESTTRGTRAHARRARASRARIHSQSIAFDRDRRIAIERTNDRTIDNRSRIRSHRISRIKRARVARGYDRKALVETKRRWGGWHRRRARARASASSA